MNLRNNTFIRFGIVGIINTIVGMTVMFVMFNLLGCGYWVSSAANYIARSIVSYFLNRNFTFNSTSKHSKTLVPFVLNIVICYLIAYGVAKPFIAYVMAGAAARLQGNVALIAGTVLFIVLNYLGQRFFVFRK